MLRRVPHARAPHKVTGPRPSLMEHIPARLGLARSS